MKINWGTAIVLVFIGFISFIMFFVIKMNTNEQYEHDLVTDDYYKKELAFQKEIDAQKNAKSLKTNIIIKEGTDELTIIFPKEKKYSKIEGTITFYRPSNKKLDFTFPIVLKSNELSIPKSKLIEGRWDIIINWEYNKTSYQFKKSLSL